jgi:extradiol dioxygenase family protein
LIEEGLQLLWELKVGIHLTAMQESEFDESAVKRKKISSREKSIVLSVEDMFATSAF